MQPEDLDAFLAQIDTWAAEGEAAQAAAEEERARLDGMSWSELMADALGGQDEESAVLQPGYVPAPLQPAAPAMLGLGAGSSAEFDPAALARQFAAAPAPVAGLAPLGLPLLAAPQLAGLQAGPVQPLLYHQMSDAQRAALAGQLQAALAAINAAGAAAPPQPPQQ